MAYKIATTLMGYQALDQISTVQNHPLGTIVKGLDPTYGEGEFIYLLGVASTVAGSLVSYSPATGQTTLVAAGGGAPVAVAMAANVAASYGWYQMSGVAVVKKTAVKYDPAAAPARKVYISGTAGRIMQTSSSGKQVLGAATAESATVTSTTSTLLVRLNRPVVQGQIT